MNILYVTSAIMLVLTIMSVPVAISLLLACVAGIVMTGDTPMFLVVQKSVEGLNSFPLLAIPLFLLAGELMNSGDITGRGVAVFNSVFGRFRGSLAYTAVGTNMFLSGISGSAVGDAAATASVLVPAMKKQGYRASFAAALCAAASTAGPIIPPSIALVVYGIVTRTSILELFVAGYIPGLVLCLVLLGYVRFKAAKEDMPRLPRTSTREKLSRFRAGGWAMIAPLLIVAGTVGGVFTVTELGAVLVLYALGIGILAHRAIRMRDLPGQVQGAALTAANIMIVVGASTVLAYLYVINGVPAAVPDLILGITDNKLLILLVVNVLFLLVGAFLDSTPATIIFVPIILPLMVDLGVDPVQFGIIVVFNLMIGLLHPPLCLSLYITSAIAGETVGSVFSAVLPMIGLLFIVLALITYVPAISLWLPHLAGY